MSVADRAAGPLAAQSGALLEPSEAPGRVLVPYGQGRSRGLDAGELGAHGAAMDPPVALGLPVVPGLTVPAGASASLGEPDTAEAAVGLVEQLAGRRIGDTGRPLLLRLSASAPTEIAGLPPDLACLGVTSGNADDLCAVIGRAEALYEVWAATVRMIAEYALGVSGAELDDALLDTPEPRARVEALLSLVARHGSRPFPDDPAQQLALAARALLARWDSPRARRSRRAQRLPAGLSLALHVQALRIGPARLRATARRSAAIRRPGGSPPRAPSSGACAPSHRCWCCSSPCRSSSPCSSGPTSPRSSRSKAPISSSGWARPHWCCSAC
ncbi:hypothetical protein SAFG77S_08410 [Streptomyces afghaniensis]